MSYPLDVDRVVGWIFFALFIIALMYAIFFNDYGPRDVDPFGRY